LTPGIGEIVCARELDNDPRRPGKAGFMFRSVADGAERNDRNQRTPVSLQGQGTSFHLFLHAVSNNMGIDPS
jgi:hypothetical protein